MKHTILCCERMLQAEGSSTEKVSPECEPLALSHSHSFSPVSEYGLALVICGHSPWPLHVDLTDQHSECLWHLITTMNNEDGNLYVFKKHYPQIFGH